jgi:hypothetical protein
MGAFNEWVRGSFLAEPSARRVATVARNILFGAAVLARANALQIQGVTMRAHERALRPLRDEELAAWFAPPTREAGARTAGMRER